MKRKNQRQVQTNRRKGQGGTFAKMVGVVLATMLILATVLGAVGAGNLGDLLTMHADAADTASIEMYVNGREAASIAGKGENRHLGLARFDEVFTCDIQAYVTREANQMEISCVLAPELEVVLPDAWNAARSLNAEILHTDGSSAGAYPVLDCAIQPAAGDAAPALNTPSIGTLPADDMGCLIQDNRITVRVNTLRGNWINLSFDARIKGSYSATSEGAAQVMAGINTNAGTEGGLKSTVSYTTASDYESSSDTADDVTVMPEGYAMTVYVNTAGNDALTDADAVKAMLGLFQDNGAGSGEERNLTEYYKGNMTVRQNDSHTWQAEWTGLPVLNENTVYRVRTLDAATQTYSGAAYTQAQEINLSPGAQAQTAARQMQTGQVLVTSQENATGTGDTVTVSGTAEPSVRGVLRTDSESGSQVSVTDNVSDITSDNLTLVNVPEEKKLYATIEWRDDPNPPDVVSLKVIADRKTRRPRNMFM